jgi:DNA-binding CsgD family transcriptional regulator
VSSVELGAADLRAMLELVGAAHEASGAAQFGAVLMHGLSSVVACDLISYNEIDLVGGATQTFFEPALVPRPEIEEAFASLIHEHPLVAEYAATRNPRPLLMSDFASLSELRRLELYHEVFRPLETNHQLAFSLTIDSDVVIGIGLNRRRGDFSHRDVEAMTLLRPHLACAFAHVVLKDERRSRRGEASQIARRLAALTPREREVAALVAAGDGNRRIARTLSISTRTAEKHVANILSKLGVESRVQAVAVLHRPEPGATP